MTEYTPNFLPYPSGTDKVVNGDDQIGALAKALRFTGGSAVFVAGSALYKDVDITFPAGLFTEPPIVLSENITRTSGVALVVAPAPGTVTVNGATLRMVAGSEFTIGATVPWFAIQIPVEVA